jgi:outer membrane protein assembly factor BamD (BamD/ComL family)
MRNQILLFLATSIVFTAALSTAAQRSLTPAVERDPVMEQDAKHNLDVAWQAYAPAKKAYKQVISRFEETYAAYPDFSKIDEFLYLAGMSSYYLSENKGKQRVDLKSDKEKDKYDPVKLRGDSKTYLSLIVDKYPQSKYAEESRKTLQLLAK